METFRLLTVLALVINLAGCPIEGDTGGTGINCWDLNQNRLNDPDEDINNDGVWDVNDCRGASIAAQNAEVAFNHQHLCEAFANLGEYPSGCPSNTHTPPTGTLTELTSTSWFDDGMGTDYSCNQPPSSNGPVSIKEINNHYYWVVEGGFIASNKIIDGLDELQNSRCYNNCLADSDCIASWANSYTVGNRVVYQCYIFHHSDTISPWEELCGVNRNDCFITQTTQVQRWSALCP
ncbi:hypothetical protein M1D72_06285 [Vibrio sp. AK197]